jgi:hypothetical protein
VEGIYKMKKLLRILPNYFCLILILLFSEEVKADEVAFVNSVTMSSKDVAILSSPTMSSIDIAVLDSPSLSSKDIFVSLGNCNGADIEVQPRTTMSTKDIALLNSVTMSSTDVAVLNSPTMSSIDLAVTSNPNSSLHFCFPRNFNIEKKHIAAIYALFFHKK